MIVLPSDNGFNVLIWGKSSRGSMRVRSFDDRTTMIALLENLRLLSPQQARKLANLDFIDSCPIYRIDEIDETSLEAHGFRCQG
jgi:hypothetical protein